MGKRGIPKEIVSWLMPYELTLAFFFHSCSDGRIKVFGGDNIEGILISPKQTSFKNLVVMSIGQSILYWTLDVKIKWFWRISWTHLTFFISSLQFLENQGFLASVTNDNEIQVPYKSIRVLSIFYGQALSVSAYPFWYCIGFILFLSCVLYFF